MTSTPVKDVGSILGNLTRGTDSSAKAAGSGEFQAVFKGQTGRESADSPTDTARPDQPGKAEKAVGKAPGDSLRTRNAHRVRVSEEKPAEREDLPPGMSAGDDVEVPEEILEVLGNAAMDLMGQIADTFGITLQELEGAMRELGMEPLDVLDKASLGDLILQLGGAADPSALVTDAELYESYQQLMNSQETLIQDASETLKVSPEQLRTVLEAQEAVPTEEIPAEPEEAEEAETSEPLARETAPKIQIIPQAGLEEELVKAGEEKTPFRESEPIRQTEDSTQPEKAQAEETQPDGTQPAREEETSEREDGGRESQPDERGDRQVLAQSFRADPVQTSFSAQVQQTEASTAWSTDTQDIMRQIMDYMRIQVRPETSQLEMQLHPESLGTLHIQLSSRGGMVTANFITQNEAVKAALESQMIQLKESFEQQGVKVEAIEVTVQSHAFERNLDQGRGQNSGQEQTAKRARARRIAPMDPVDVEEPGEREELAADLLAASGSQVDYTA